MNISRRQFLQGSFYSGLLYGTGALPRFVNEANAEFVPLQNKILVNLMLDGGPDLRHLIAPAWNATPGTVGNAYWKNRWRAHRLPNDQNSTLAARWNSAYYPIQVGGSGWTTSGADTSALNDDSNANDTVTFGIWKEAGWLIDMFLDGNVAIVANAVVGRNRDHSHSTIIMEQGNLTAGSNAREHSGWGGRLAQQAGGSPIALTDVPRPFCFGAKNGNANQIDNSALVAVQNSRQLGLYGFDETEHRSYHRAQKIAGALESYYAALRMETPATDAYEKFMDHENKVRVFGELIKERLDFAEPLLIRALHSSNLDNGGGPTGLNPDPANGDSRRTLRSSGFGRQIRNLYDVMASNDLLNLRVASMSYGGWDTHENQRRDANSGDLNDPDTNRGIESNFKDIFGGPSNRSGLSSTALHGGFSALWNSLQSSADRDKILINIAGEFGRQIRDNGDRGTDHGKGNYMLLIGNEVHGGLYGELFPESEIDQLNNSNIRTPDIDPLTDFDHVFGAACDWVSPGSGGNVFPGRSTNSNLESGVSPENLFI
ncbi:MAG: DUF1501 domain-containing protein [Acidiferrobacterales bacterium]|nr:DUF1501 domain-containing protein [Acidiferrobacterales bacterium]